MTGTPYGLSAQALRTSSTARFAARTRHAFGRGLATSAPPPPSPSRLQKYARRALYTGAGIGTLWAIDTNFNASAITRNFRTIYMCGAIALDYSINFTPAKSESIPQLHERVAERMYNLLTKNGGLYIKIGQAIGANAAMLPKPVQIKFQSLFDDAPQVPYSVVESVFRSEFGRPPSGPDGVFEIFEEQAVASASIAQVHKAKLRGSDQWVAVKIQKPDVVRQTWWDLTTYKGVMWLYDRWFELPVYFLVDYISDHLRQELDFIREADNARRTAAFVRADPNFAQRVHIPEVYEEYSTKRVMTAEWIDGVRLSDRDSVLRLVGEKPPLPGTDAARPLQGGARAVMQTMVELFSAQMFSWGWVHCDPHPGNVLIRPNPSKPTQPQLVLLDHGLYVSVSEEMRRQWASVFKAMLIGDRAEVESVVSQWGVGLGMGDLFASFALMRPVRLKGARTGPPIFSKEATSDYERGVQMKAALRNFLVDTDRMPKVLAFLLRNMRMVQGNNQSLGSPVNRIRITATYASRALAKSPNLSLGQRLHAWWQHFVFQTIMFSSDAVFYWVRIRQYLGRVLGYKVVGFEDELESIMRRTAKSTLGLEINEDTFAG
ncbi:ABC1 family-domain-containing protein [Schizophyllum commune]